jgi:hypothetical protein
MRTIVELQVLAGDELLLSRGLRPRQPLCLGPGARATVPTLALDLEVPVLVPAPGGYRVQLPRGLDGHLLAAGRRLRIVDGLLCDPRPEPLLLVGGDEGELALGDGLRLRFALHAQRRELRPRLRLDRGLALSLSGVAVVALALVLICLEGGPRAGITIREPRLVTRPASLVALQRTRPPALRPATPPGASRASPRRARPARAIATAPRTAERILRRLLPSSSSRRGDPLAALDGLLARAGRGQAASRLGGTLLTGTRAGLGLGDLPRGGIQGGLPDALALPAVAPLARELPRPAPAATPNAGGPSREAIRKVVARGSVGVRLCYERELLAARIPREGQIVLRWEIDSRGKVAGVQIAKDTVGSAALAACLTAEVSRWTFPPCPERCSIHYPFDFYARSLGGV